MASLYEADFVAWAESQAAALRRLADEHPELAGRLDLPNLIEEVETMGASLGRELISRLTVLLAHLAKWQWQPSLQTRSWRNTIDEQRDQIGLLLDDNPSLRPRLPAAQAKAWALARKKAHRETGLDVDTFPMDCPFALDDVLAEGWLPG